MTTPSDKRKCACDPQWFGPGCNSTESQWKQQCRISQCSGKGACVMDRIADNISDSNFCKCDSHFSNLEGAAVGCSRCGAASSGDDDGGGVGAAFVRGLWGGRGLGAGGVLVSTVSTNEDGLGDALSSGMGADNAGSSSSSSSSSSSTQSKTHGTWNNSLGECLCDKKPDGTTNWEGTYCTTDEAAVAAAIKATLLSSVTIAACILLTCAATSWYYKFKYKFRTAPSGWDEFQTLTRGQKSFTSRLMSFMGECLCFFCCFGWCGTKKRPGQRKSCK